MAQPTIDHRGPDFVELAGAVLAGIRPVFGTTGLVFIFPASASGGWEAALVNTLSPGDRVLMFDHGFFAANWHKVAARFDLTIDFVPSDWRRGVDAEVVAERLSGDAGQEYKAVMVVHNETSTGVTSRIATVREAMDRVGHPALLMVDAVSSLGSLDYRHDAWGVDVTIAGSQKGLMLPPGLCFNAVSAKAMAASEQARLPRSYWNWQAMMPAVERGTFPYTPATNLLFGLREALAMLHEEGLERVHARHGRLAEATRRAVAAWGLENYCLEPEEYSNTVTTVLLPDGVDGDALRAVILERFDMSLGTGLGKLKGKVFRVGHLGDFNDLMLAGTLCGVEMGFQVAGTPHQPGGVAAAMQYLSTGEK